MVRNGIWIFKPGGSGELDVGINTETSQQLGSIAVATPVTASQFDYSVQANEEPWIFAVVNGVGWGRISYRAAKINDTTVRIYYTIGKRLASDPAPTGSVLLFYGTYA